MKILTLNTWQERGPWRERWEYILRGISEQRPDIVAFQEVFNPAWMQTVQRRCGYFSLVLPGKGETGLAILSHYPLIRSAFIRVKTRSPAEPYYRYAQCAELDTGRGSVMVYNTHLSWRIPESLIRQKQVGELLSFIAASHTTQEVMLMGDFNATPETDEIKNVLKRGAFRDAYGELYPGPKGLTWCHRNPYSLEAARLDACYPLPERRLDYIFFSRGSRLMKGLRDAVIVFDRPDARGYWASDHFGVLATIEAF